MSLKFEDENLFEDYTTIQNKLRSRAKLILYLLGFLVNFDQFIILPSAWFFVDKLGGSESFYGWVLSSFSIAELVASFIFGALSDKISPKKILVPMLAFMATGNIIYALAVNKWMLLFGRALAGIGASIIGVALGYISKITTMKDRTDSISLFWMIAILAMVCAPGIGASLSKINFKTTAHSHEIAFDGTTAPAWLTAVLTLMCLLLTIISFKEPQNSTGEGVEELDFHSPSIPVSPVPVLIFVNFAITFVLSGYETLVTPMTSSYFGWEVGSNALLFLAIGGVVFITVFLSGALTRVLQERTLILGGNLILFLGLMLGSNFFPKVLPIRHKPVFISTALLITFGFSINSAILPSIITKYLPASKHGMIMGIFSSLTSLAQILGPLWAGNTVHINKADETQDERLAVIGMVSMSGLAVLVILAFYIKLLPERYHRAAPGSNLYERGSSLRVISTILSNNTDYDESEEEEAFLRDY